MILGYGGRNCWSFKDWMEIDFRINRNVPDEYGFEDKRVVPALCFEGGNAAGKSCALKVLSFIVDFCLNSFSYQSDGPILYDTFFHNKEKSEFYISFTLQDDINTEYLYEITLDKVKVYNEKLTAENSDGKRVLLHRLNDTIKENVFFSSVDAILLRKNASFISTFIQYGVKEINAFKNFFSSIRSNVSYLGTQEEQLTDFVAGYYKLHPELHRRVVEQLKEYDTGVKDVEIVNFIGSNGENNYLSVFHHDVDAESDELTFFSQSTGTKILYNRLRDLFLTMDEGGFLIFDELDNHLHSFIMPLLLEGFLNKDENKNHAQLVFTSHNTSLLDDMKKYRTYLFKKIKGEAICYRVDELPRNIEIRNDRPLEPIYRSGVLGGLPDV